MSNTRLCLIDIMSVGMVFGLIADPRNLYKRSDGEGPIVQGSMQYGDGCRNSDTCMALWATI